MVNRNARKVLEGGIDQVKILAGPADGWIGGETRNDGIAEGRGFIIALLRNMGTMGFMALLADLQEIP